MKNIYKYACAMVFFIVLLLCGFLSCQADANDGEDGAMGINGENGQDGKDGESIKWKGELWEAPLYPERLWAYYNKIDGNSYIFNGTAWDYLAHSGRNGATGIMLWMGSFSSHPQNAQNGWAYHNTTDKKSYIYDGSVWSVLCEDGTDGRDGTDGTDGENGKDGKDGIDGNDGIDGQNVVWKGTLPQAPLNPKNLWAYFNTTDKITYIFDGAKWDTMAVSLGGDTNITVPIEWKGDLPQAPADALVGWTYYNTSTKCSYIYDGSIWQKIASDGRDGKDGIDGKDGTDGKDGVDGKDGINGSDGQDGTDGKDGTDGADGTGDSSTIIQGFLMNWKGSFSSHPALPKAGWAYYNTSDKCSYIFDGAQWQVFARDGKDGTGIGGTSGASNAEIKIFVNDNETSYYNFGSYDYGEESNFVTFTIKNTGSDTLVLGDSKVIEHFGGMYDYIDQFEIDVSKTASSVLPGATTTFSIKYKPTKAGQNISMNSYIPSNAKNGISYFYCYGSCRAPDLYIIMDVNGVSYTGYQYMYNLYKDEQYKITSIDFGTAFQNIAIKTTQFYIMNNGANNKGTTLRFTKDIEITGADAASFDVIQPSKMSLGDSESVTPTLIFKPTSPGVKTATVTIYTNAPGCETYSFEVTGKCITQNPNDPDAQMWPKYFDGGEGDGNDVIMCGAHDSKGNLYFAGYGFELVNDHSGYDWWIKKFDITGDEITAGWNKKFSYYDDYSGSAPIYDNPSKIVIDKNDDIVVASRYNVVKFSSNGTKLWERSSSSGNFKDIYSDDNGASYIVLSTATEKISNNGAKLWSVPTTNKIAFGPNQDFATYGANFAGVPQVSLYSSNCTLQNRFLCSDAKTKALDSNTWINSSLDKDEKEFWSFPVTAGKKYYVQMNNSGEGDGTKTGNIKLSAYYLSSGVSMWTNDGNMYNENHIQTFTPATNDIIIISAEPYSNYYLGTYAFRVMEFNPTWKTGSVSATSQTQSFTFNVVQGKVYAISYNDKYYGDNTKTGRIEVSAKYSDGSAILSSTSSNFYSTPKLFIANKTSTVTLTAELYSSSYTGTFAVALDELTILSSYEQHKPISVNSLCFDPSGNIYVAGYCENAIDNYSRKDVRIKKYLPSGEAATDWDKIIDWGHCDDEYATNISFNNGTLFVYGNGNDLLSGASKSDTWFKKFSLSGEELSSFVIDDTGYTLQDLDADGNYYLANGYDLYKYDALGNLKKQFNTALTPPHIYCQYNYFIGNSGGLQAVFVVNTDGAIYGAGYAENVVTSSSGEDWAIKKFD